MNTENRNCKRCDGTGINVSRGFTTASGEHFPEIRSKCWSCEGNGTFAPLDIPAILTEIKGRKGLRSARPKSARAYYIWRMARFHGGVDVTMPVCASLDNDGDPFLKELDALADAVAKRVYGTDKAAAYRWGRAMGYSLPDNGNLPATAYAGGPVVTAEKPLEEMMELL